MKAIVPNQATMKMNIKIYLLSDMQALYFILMTGKSRGEKILVEKVTDYVDRVIPNYSNAIFREHFR